MKESLNQSDMPPFACLPISSPGLNVRRGDAMPGHLIGGAPGKIF
jgi:hypothetical protein